MKKLHQNHQQVTVIRATDDSFVQSLNDIQIKEIIPETIERAKDDASRNLPSTTTQSPIHFEFLTSRYNRLVVEYKGQVQRDQEQYHANKEIQQFKTDQKRHSEKLNEVNNRLRIKERALENLTSFQEKMKDYRKALFGILLLTCSEALLVSSSMQLLVPNMLFSIIIGATFAVALYYSAIIGAKLLRLAKDTLRLFLTSIGILSVIGVVFYTLGYFRILYLNEMSDSGELGYALSPLQFCLIQLFFYSCAILLKFFYMPEKAEQEQFHSWRRAKEDITKLSRQKGELEKAIEEQEKTLSYSLITRKTLISSAKDVERKIDALYRDAYQHYVKTNLHHRSDNSIPACFEQKDILPNLALYFQDDAILQFNEEDIRYE